MKKLLIHPFLIAVFPIFSLWASNVEYINAGMVVRSLVFAIILASLSLLLVHLVTREWVKAGVIVSLLLLVIFTYGYFYTELRGVDVLNPLIRHRYLIPLIGAMLGFLIFLVYKNNGVVSSFALFLTVIGMVLVSLSLAKIILYEVNANSVRNESAQSDEEISVSVQANTPDIYYIVLDAYGREDTLKEFYNFDNSEFIQSLKRRGFYVADKSNSNYMETMLSLSSTLNMDYLDKYVSQNGGRLSTPFLSTLIGNSKLRELLSRLGYKVVAFDTSYEDLSTSDVFLKPREQKNLSAKYQLSINEFEGILLDTTIGKVWLDIFYNQQNVNADSMLRAPYLKHANRIIFTLTELGNVAKIPDRKFVVAHVVSPHPPFVFNSDGDLVYPPRSYSLSDGNNFQGGRDEYISGYAGQLQYINKLVLRAIDDIMANTSEPPIIIIQGDHGPGLNSVWGSVEQSNVQDRMAIINAYYFPGQDYSMLYPSISPVNSFRVILDKFFGTNLQLLPDNHFFTTGVDRAKDYSWTQNFTNVNRYLNK